MIGDNFCIYYAAALQIGDVIVIAQSSLVVQQCGIVKVCFVLFLFSVYCYASAFWSIIVVYNLQNVPAQPSDVKYAVDLFVCVTGTSHKHATIN